MTYSDRDKLIKTYIDNKEDEIILCIPLMDIAIDNEYIHYIFNKLNIGVEKIYQYINKNNENAKRVILHLKKNPHKSGYNPKNANTNQYMKYYTQIQSDASSVTHQISMFDYIKTRLEENKDIKIVYNYPHYWKMVKAYK
jgi:IS30 family transposase